MYIIYGLFDLFAIGNVYIFLVCFVETGTSRVFSYTLVCGSTQPVAHTKPWKGFLDFSFVFAQHLHEENLANKVEMRTVAIIDITKRCHNFGCQ